MLWDYIGNENICKLSSDTENFLNEYVGVSNLQNFTIAMEIHLAELMIPSFKTTSEDELTIRLESFIKSFMNRKNTEMKEDPLYFFENLNVLEKKFKYDDIEPKRALMKGLASYVLGERYRKGTLLSDVAKSLHLQHLKLNENADVNRAMLLSEIYHYQNENNTSENELYEKLLHVLAVQHKEMYYLEMDRLRNNVEYKIYEEFEPILSLNTKQFILSK